MYRACMFCNRPLGANETLETFPVGRRLAFDPERGRLWVVCIRCQRWNLTPLEERWEAVEDCERLFASTRLRVSSPNIGLARLADGLELVRIGRPLPGEFAAWRYGDQFGRRRRRAMLYAGGIAVAIGAFTIGGMVTGAISSGLVAQSGNFVNLFQMQRTRARFKDGDEVVRVKGADLMHSSFETPAAGGDWRLTFGRKRRRRVYEGLDALRVAAKVMPGVNEGGGSRRQVSEALGLLTEAGGPEAFLRADLGPLRAGGRRRRSLITAFPRVTRLALEMALHEERERRAMEGELWLLEQMWREAEEIAAIADSLLLPEGTEAFLERHREPGGEEQGRGRA
ncbi:MAG: hypothetical protein D6701_04860 [Gemmatimonadetes bacterium]|nr:MAG: hypothetical protein D6701_04860 [Gemmatimonadota bacterium]